mmetsp:Transcript_51971/g.103433  ORF Transcript_51971/g.103433 Transcript_51971/m.103433 type:complete len:232 (+) Transcript_51971:2327-3022(+)
MRRSSRSVFGTFGSSCKVGVVSSCSSASEAIKPFFALDRPRRTGRAPPPLRSWSPPMEMEPRMEPRPLAVSVFLAFLPSTSTYARIIVMSSVRTSNCSQSSYALAQTARQAMRGSSCLSTMSTTAWLVRNSQIPSEQMMMNLSCSFSSFLVSSGSAITPTRSPIASPIDRVKAHPGFSFPGTHTRGGSPSVSVSAPRSMSQLSCIGTTPSRWSTDIISPPAVRMRSLSSLR